MNKTKSENPNIPCWFWAATAIVVIAWLLVPAFSYWTVGESKPGISGQIGDTFGVVTSLFSGMAFLGVCLAIYFQREELRATREQLSDAAAAQETLARLQSIQLELAVRQMELEVRKEALAVRTLYADPGNAYKLKVTGFVERNLAPIVEKMRESRNEIARIVEIERFGSDSEPGKEIPQIEPTPEIKLG